MADPNADEKKNENEDDPTNLAANYKVSKRVSVSELQNKDKDDKSLAAYKKSLGLDGDNDKIFDEKNPNSVILTSFKVLVPGREGGNIEIKPADLQEGKTAFILKEGCNYQIQINFQVQRNIVSRATLKNKVSRKMFSTTEETI